VPGGSNQSTPTSVVTEVDFSCRLPLLVFFISAAIWLVIGSVFSLVASVKFHDPNFLANCPCLTYGRVHPAALNSLLYGCCVQGGLGVGLWLLARLGQTPLAHRWLVTVGAKFWNLGVTLGVVGIFVGDSTGFKTLEIPSYGALIMFLGYLLVGIWGVATFHHRRERALFVSQWFIFTALFWFPWIYSSANMLLLRVPVRGVAQAVVAWWYSENLLTVWFGLVGLAAVFYFVPKILKRELHSSYLGLLAFWTLIFFGGWGVVPNTAPVPAWMPTLSTVAIVLTIIPLLSAATNVCLTVRGGTGPTPGTCAQTSLWFILFGVVCLLVGGLARAAGVVLDQQQMLHFTWFVPAREHLQIYGFFVMVLFGAVYYILPSLAGIPFPSTRLVRLHFWVAAAGLVIFVLPLLIGGIIQTTQLQNAAVPFTDIMKSGLVFLRFSTMGELLLLFGHLIFVVNVLGLVNAFYKARVEAAYAEVTADLFKPMEARS
jgi:cytochrome c oxidase cbb3-type subunit 1